MNVQAINAKLIKSVSSHSDTSTELGQAHDRKALAKWYSVARVRYGAVSKKLHVT
jgi:hypothetical protein